jgi:hypothetical protein
MASHAAGHRVRQPGADVVAPAAPRAFPVGVGRPAGPRVLLIRDLAALHALLRRPQVVKRGARRPVLLDVPGTTPDERAVWDAALDAYRRDCGCSMGGAFSLLAIALVLAWRGWSLAQAGGVTLGSVLAAALVALGIGVVMGGVGKAVGLARARARFRRVVTRIIARIDERSPDVA